MPAPRNRASIDPNWKSSLLAVSSTDGVTPVALEANETTGALLVELSGGGGSSGQQYADGATRGTATGTLGMVDDGTNIQSMAGDTNGNARVVGNVDAGSTDSGSPVKIGGKYSSTPPTLTNGQRGDAFMGPQSQLVVSLLGSVGGTLINGNGTNSDGIATTVSATALRTIGFGFVYNGSTFDRMPGDTTGVRVKQRADTSTASNVAASATSVTLLSANTGRIGGSIVNDSTAVLYIKFGATASTSSYKVALSGQATAPYSYYEIPAGYTGRIDGIWASATGNARISEET